MPDPMPDPNFPAEPFPSDDSRRDDPTTILNAAAAGDGTAADRLLPLVYEELRRLADRQLRGQPDRDALGSTALVHEAYIKLIDGRAVAWNGRDHFVAVAATAMRQILVDHARARRTLKQGGGWRRVALSESDAVDPDGTPLLLDLIALDEALNELATLDDRQRRVVEMRVFGGMTAQQTATALGISKTTVDNDWRAACAWLNARLRGTPPC